MTQRFSSLPAPLCLFAPAPLARPRSIRWHVVCDAAQPVCAPDHQAGHRPGPGRGDASRLFWAAGLILGIAVIRGIAGFLTMYNGEWITFRVAYDLRNDFFRAVQTLPFAFHDKAHTGDLMSRATGDISETERFAGTGMVQLSPPSS